MAFNIFSAGDPLLASTMMQNFRHVNYGKNLLPVNSSGVGANNTLDLGSSTYKWKDLYLSNDAFVGDHLGVGTLTPQKKVHIHEETASTECLIRVTNAQNTDGFQLGINSQDDAVIANLDADADMIFYTGGANARATIKADGEVGIGTSFPTSLFHIHKASATGVNLQITNSNTGATSGDGLFIGIDSSDNDAYIINKENKDLYFGVGNSEKMRLQYSTGYLGLGTNDPQRNLHINVSDSGVAFAHFTNSTTGSTTNDGFTIGLTENEDGFISVRENTNLIIETNNTEKMRITSAGKFGLGCTPSHAAQIYVADSNESALSFTNSTTGATSGDGFLVGIDSGEAAKLWQYEDNYMVFGTKNIERMRLTSDGEFGVNMTSPYGRFGITTSGESITSFSLHSSAMDSNLASLGYYVDDTSYFTITPHRDQGIAHFVCVGNDASNPLCSYHTVYTRAVDSTTSTAADGAYKFNTFTHDGSGNVSTPGDDDNLFVICDGSTARIICKGDGDIYTDTDQTGGLAGTFDSEDDIILCQTLQHSIAGSDGYEHWDREIFNKNKDRLEELGIMKNGFLSNNKSKALLLGSVSQLYNIVKGLAKKLNLSEEQIMQMAKEY